MKLRNCDLIEGMDYIKTCTMCGGEGEYPQTYTAGCGGGYFTMNATCHGCDGAGIRKTNNEKVPTSVLLQIEQRRTKRKAEQFLTQMALIKDCGWSCKYWTHDMDGDFCTHPVSFEIAPNFGASPNRMGLEGRCMTDKYGNKPEIAYELWEPRETASHG